jgi:DNA-binding CsgD family transcriptional regulator
MTALQLRDRVVEVTVIRDRLAEMANGNGGVLLVEGPPGIGKTRLLVEASRVAMQDGVLVASGGADELAELTPLRWLLDAFRSTDPPIVGSDVIPRVSVEGDQRLVVLEHLRESLEDVARHRAVLIALDDLQWADAASLLAVRVLTRQLAGYPILWMLARRPHPAPQALLRTIDQLLSDGAVPLQVRPLPDEAVIQMVHDLLGAHPDSSVRDAAKQAAGNPFYVSELMRSLRVGGTIMVQAGTAQLVDQRMPAEFHTAIAAQLVSLSPVARELLDVAAVAGRQFVLTDVATVLSRSAATLVAPLRELIESEILIELDGDLVFRHDLLREAVYQRLPASLREALHREVASALLARGVSPVDAAVHLSLGARPGDRHTAFLLADAAQQIAMTAPASAAEVLQRALVLLPKDDPERTRLVTQTITLLGFAGRPHEAEAVAGEEMARVRNDDVAIVIALGHALQLSGRYRSVQRLSRQVLEVAQQPDETRAFALNLAAASSLFLGDWAGCVQCASAIIALRASDDLTYFRANAYGLLGLSGLMQGDLGEAERLARQGCELAEAGLAAGRRGQPRIPHAVTLGALDRVAEARTVLEAGRREANELGLRWALPHYDETEAMLLLAEGQLDDAAALAEALLDNAAALDIETPIPHLHGLLAQVALRRSDLASARAQVSLLEVHAEEADVIAAVQRHHASGRLAFAEGDAHRAVELLAPLYEPGQRYTLVWTSDVPLGPELVRIALAGDRADFAHEMLISLDDLSARNADVPSVVAAARHARGLVDQDAARLQLAVDDYRRSPRRLALATALTDLGLVLATTNERTRGIETLRASLDLYRRCGASLDVDRVQGHLRRLGIRTHKPLAARPVTGWASLTPAERRVGELAASGLTNREIADRLRVSAHTVNTHLDHVFAKLSIRSRVELARISTVSTGGT